MLVKYIIKVFLFLILAVMTLIRCFLKIPMMLGNILLYFLSIIFILTGVLSYGFALETARECGRMILSILVDTFISKISLPMQPVPEIRSISGA